MKVLKTVFHFLTKDTVLLCIILLLAGILRFYHLNTTPASLNIDETSIGYTAYSLLLTGKDEYGKPLSPIYESFGDWKLSGYPLLTVIPIVVFGLNEFAVRFSSALAGVIQVLLIYALCRLLFPKQKRIGLLAAFFYALSPWGIYFSRIAYETNVAATFFLGGLYAFLLAKDTKKPLLFILSAFLFASTLYLYHSYMITIPLFTLGLLALYWKQIPKTKVTLLAGGILVILSAVIFYLVSTNSLSKFSSMGVVNNPNVLYNRADVFRTNGADDNPFVAKILFNKYTSSFYQIGQNYLMTFSPEFLFDTGGKGLMNSLGDFGIFYLTDVLFLLTGIILLIYRHTKEKAFLLLLLWLVVAPIPTAITTDAPTATRLLMMLPLFIIIASYGAYEIILFCVKKKPLILALGLLGLLFLWNILLFLDIYFVHMNYRRARFQHYGYEQTVELTNKYPTLPVVMNGPDNFPYISFLFYTQYDPATYQKEAAYYPRDGRQFVRVKGFDRYHFVESINYKKLQPNTLYIDKTNPKPAQFASFTTKGTINAPNGEIILWYFIP